jgi:predicted RNA methylase
MSDNYTFTQFQNVISEMRDADMPLSADRIAEWADRLEELVRENVIVPKEFMQACERLSANAEECQFDDNLGFVAAAEWWEAFDDQLDELSLAQAPSA